MKYLLLSLISLISLISLNSYADETYHCDSDDLNATEQVEGSGKYSVLVKTGGGADVIVTPLNPTEKPYTIFNLNIFTQDGRIFSSNNILDARVIFSRSSDEKAGLLRIQSTMPLYGGGLSPENMFICTK